MNVLALVEAFDLADSLRQVLEPVVDALWVVADVGEVGPMLSQQTVDVVVAATADGAGQALAGVLGEATVPLVVLGCGDGGWLAARASECLPVGEEGLAALPYALR